MGLMVPIIRRNRGLLNKLLGDGIMFYFNAPLENPAHAIDAINAALEMQEAMKPLHLELAREGIPPLGMRVGISSGRMVVGNCGPSDRTFSDYTVLGDTVNLGSRLEGANKVFGTRIMVNDRAYDLAADRFLFRPLGKVQVKGKRQGVMTYEALARIEAANDAHRKLAEMTAAVVTPFMAGDFRACLVAIEQMETLLGASKFTVFYRELCEQYLRQPPVGFDGQIVLTEK
jgi:adenylate cyclase